MVRRGTRSRYRSARASTDSQVFARARPALLRIEEQYDYQQVVSRNPSRGHRGQARGRLTIAMPYDGYEHFTREAAQDVERPLRERPADSDDVTALIGYLVLVDHRETDLAEVLPLDGRSGAHGLHVPVRSAVLDCPAALVSDQHEYRVAVDYEPSAAVPELVPIELKVELWDPDHSDGPISAAGLQELLTGGGNEDVDHAVDAIKQFVGFQPYLRLDLTVQVTLPARLNGSGRKATAPTRRRRPESSQLIVRRLGVRLPATTSLAPSSIELKIDGAETQHFLHDQATGLLECFDIEMRPLRSTEDRARDFHSARVELLFRQPGELFARPELELEAEVEVPDELLSGTDARFFDATGRRYGRSVDPLAIRSILTTRCTVVLRDAFARRLVSPYQSFHFDEIVPSKMRVTDVVTALTDQRFEIIVDKSLRLDKKNKQLRHVILAKRTDGPDMMLLYVVIEGNKHATERQARHSGGHRYTSKFPSGELRLFVRGQVPRNASRLVNEINELQLALRDRFRRLKAHR